VITLTKQPLGSGCSTIVQTPIIGNDENVNPDEATDWLHRNDNYKGRRPSEHTFPSNIPDVTPQGS